MAIGTLRWAAGGFCALVGALMLVAPEHFGATFAALRPHPAPWAALVLLAGVGLVAVAALGPGPRLSVGAHVLAGAVLLGFAHATAGGWVWRANFAVLGVGTLVAPLLSNGRRERGDDPDLFALLIALALGMAGAIALLALDVPGPIAPGLTPASYAAACLVGSLALCAAQSRRAPPRWRVAGHLLAAGVLLSHLSAPLHPRAWGTVAFYGGFGALLALLPWLAPTLRRIDPSSLRTQLALALAFAAAVPLTVGLALDAHWSRQGTVAPPAASAEHRPLDSAAIRAGESGGGGDGGGRNSDVYFAMLLLFMGGAAASGAAAANWLAAPLRSLAVASRALEAGEDAGQLPASRVTEVRHLASAFDHLRDGLAARAAERDRAEAARLRLSGQVERERAALASVMASMTDGLIIVDSGWSIQYCNAQAATMLGVDPARLPGRRAAAVVAMIKGSLAEPRAACEIARRSLGRQRAPRSFEVELAGPAPRHVLVQPFTLAEGADGSAGVGVLLRDVTAERELLRAKDELVAVVSHELRTPLGSVVGFAELLLMHDWPEAERRQFLTVMVQEGQRLAALINDFLDLERLEGGRQPMAPRSTALAPLVARAVTALGPDPERPIGAEISDDLPPVRADAGRVEQVLGNLLSNARKYSPDGGAVRVTARRVGGWVEVAVQDRGLGIPPEALPRLFEKFYRVDNSDGRSIGGTGLGLAICRRIVESHGGRIRAESGGIGRGARFTFTLPVATPEAATEAPPEDGAPAGKGAPGGGRIVTADGAGGRRP